MSLPGSSRASPYENSRNENDIPGESSSRMVSTPRLSTHFPPTEQQINQLDRHAAKTLRTLTHKFIPVQPNDPAVEQQQRRFDSVYSKCARLLASQPTPSIIRDENHIANLIRRKLMQDPRDTTAASRFGQLYNKLASQLVLKHKWAMLYLMFLLSEQNGQSSSSSPAPPFSPMEASPRIGLGLPHISPPLQPRSYDMPESSRNIRRRLIDEHEEIDTSLPPAVQLARARAAARRRTDESAGDPVTESALLRDLIFVFQGIDGQYIKFDPATQEYMIDNRADVPQSTRDLVYRLTELGWLYKRVQTFVQSRFDDPSMGLVGQSFCFALRNELTNYYKLIAVLEAQIEKQQNADGITIPTEQTLTLRRLLVWTRESSQRLRLMRVLVDACQNQKGGALVSTMHNYTKHGDPFIQQYIEAMLQEVSKPFYEMLQRWIYEGELEDPYEEFFVACDPTASEEELWRSKYSIRENMIPSFISTDLAQKIFLIGKSLNFIRYSCHDDTLVEKYLEPSSLNPSVQVFKYGDIQTVERAIDATYRETSKQLIELLKQKYKLMDHLRALKRYLLLGQGDFIQYLMDTLGPGLSRPANTLFRHNLTGILETAVRASNAQYDDPEILNRLDVRLLEISPEDLGWDVFTLDYHLDSPINTVFTPQAMHQYLRMFNFLWRLKRVEYTLSASWRRWGIATRKFASVTEIAQDLHQAHLVISRMIHFVYQLQHYYLFEVLECSWEKLAENIHKSIDLDEIIEAHSSYLNEITQKGFLSGAKNRALSMRLNTLFDIILTYKSILDHLYAFGTSEVSRIQTNARSTTPPHEVEKLKKIRARRTEVENKFKKQILEFLEVLSSYHDEDLRSLSTRLDYNDYYSSQMK